MLFAKTSDPAALRYEHRITRIYQRYANDLCAVFWAPALLYIRLMRLPWIRLYAEPMLMLVVVEEDLLISHSTDEYKLQRPA